MVKHNNRGIEIIHNSFHIQAYMYSYHQCINSLFTISSSHFPPDVKTKPCPARKYSVMLIFPHGTKILLLQHLAYVTVADFAFYFTATDAILAFTENSLLGHLTLSSFGWMSILNNSMVQTVDILMSPSKFFS